MNQDVRRAIELVIGAAIAALLTIATIVYVGRVTGPAEYSDFAAALALIYLVGLALSPVIPTVARMCARLDPAAAMRLRRGLMRMTWLIALAAAIVTAFAAQPLAHWLRFQSTATLLLALLTALVWIILSVDRGVLQGLFRFHEYNINIVVEAAVRAAVVGAFIRMFPTATFALFGWAISTAVAELAIALTLRGKSAPGGRAEWDEFRRVLRPMILLMLSIAIFQNTDVLAVKRWLNPELAGAYGAASSLIRGFGVIFAPLYALAGPLLTRLDNERRAVFGATVKLAAAYAALSAIPLLIVTLWPSAIVIALYGPPYASGSMVLAPLAGIAVMTYVGLMLSQALITVHRFGFTLFYLVAAFLQVIGLGLYHRSFGQVLLVLYVTQGVALLCVAGCFVYATKSRLKSQ